ncbi:MAG: anaerobic carbon-monoxide dehydrogenase catalytic subunit [Pseudomonadota bacterium]
MTDEPKPESFLSVDPASQRMIAKAARDGCQTVFDRARALKPCPIGGEGNCCRICAMGPCRLTREDARGVCGATRQTVAARNFARMVAAGTSAHADHARGVCELFIAAAEGEAQGFFHVKDEAKLRALAEGLEIKSEGRTIPEVAREVGERLRAEFGRQGGEVVLLRRAPAKRLARWRELGIAPRGIDREVVELLHRTHMGVDQDYRSLLLAAARCSLADGWGGSMISTDLQDVLFGTPKPTLGNVNLGVLKENAVNIIVHGHEPALAEMLVVAAREPQAQEAARAVGAEGGVSLCGMCCTAAEVLMRHGIPHAGNFLMQELALVTGAVEAMVLDIQCEMQSLAEVAKCYHTRLITTSPKARIEGVEHVEFSERRGLEVARDIVRRAIENFPKRGRVEIPPEKSPAVVGFSAEAIAYMLGGSFRASYKPLAENIINGRIRGLAGVVGCNNARVAHDSVHLGLVRELIKNDVLVLSTGCAAIAFGKAGLLAPEAAALAGEGLRSVCEAVGIPPVLHMGACVDNSRILTAATMLLAEGGLGEDLSDLPVAGAAPEWMSEKAVAIGQYFVASGIFTVFGASWPTSGSEHACRFLFEESAKLFGGRFAWERDAQKMARAMLAHIDERRVALGIDKARERVLFDMARRRELGAA